MDSGTPRAAGCASTLKWNGGGAGQLVKANVSTGHTFAGKYFSGLIRSRPIVCREPQTLSPDQDMTLRSFQAILMSCRLEPAATFVIASSTPAGISASPVHQLHHPALQGIDNLTPSTRSPFGASSFQQFKRGHAPGECGENHHADNRRRICASQIRKRIFRYKRQHQLRHAGIGHFADAENVSNGIQTRGFRAAHEPDLPPSVRTDWY